MLKKLPPLLTDEDAERFVDEADLSEYDLSGGFRMRLVRRGNDAAQEAGPRVPRTDGTVVLTLSKEELDQAIEEAWEARQPLGLYLSQAVRDFLNRKAA
jgi:hypothetical protein